MSSNLILAQSRLDGINRVDLIGILIFNRRAILMMDSFECSFPSGAETAFA